jgi:hypothetical protein
LQRAKEKNLILAESLNRIGLNGNSFGKSGRSSILSSANAPPIYMVKGLPGDVGLIFAFVSPFLKGLLI